MIIPKFTNRLGNTLFQFAAAYALAARAPDTFGIVQPNWPHLKDLGLDRFIIKDPHIAQLTKLNEPGQGYNPIPYYRNGGNLELNGYFQSEKYFEDCAEEIRTIIMGPHRERLPMCAVHIRRGDYVNNPHFVDLTETGYYYNALLQIKNMPIIVFSDDIEWCEFHENRWAKSLDLNISYCYEPDPVKSIRQMALCSHVIMANSSFSWWGAWLSGTDNVIAPEKWFDGPSIVIDTSDLIPARWMRI